MSGARDSERGNGNGTGENRFVLRVGPRANSPIDYVSIIVLVISVCLTVFLLSAQIYVLYDTWYESFKGVWVIRANILLLVIVYAAVAFTFFFRSEKNQLPPSCFSIKYLKYRWPIWVLAFVALSSIPVLYVLQGNASSRLFYVLRSQVEICLITVIIFTIADSLNRYLYSRQVQANEAERPVSPAPQPANADYGYFSPKSKKGAPTLTSQKSPFDSGKFHYAR